MIVRRMSALPCRFPDADTAIKIAAGGIQDPDTRKLIAVPRR